jgi:hypothetical protein
MGYGYLGILVYIIMLLYSRGSMIYYLKGILGTLTCYYSGTLFSPDDLFHIEGFWRLVIFNEAQRTQRILYMGFFTGICFLGLLHLPLIAVVGMRIEGECWT